MHYSRNGHALKLIALIAAGAAGVGCGAAPAADPAHLSNSGDVALLGAPTATTSASTARAASAPAARPSAADDAAANSMRDLAAASKFSELQAAAEQSIARNPSHADAHFYLGVAREKSGNKAAAEDSYKRAIALLPSLEAARINLSALCIEGTRFQDAIAALGELPRAKDASAQVLDNYAYALLGQRSAEAGAAFAAAVAKSPANQELRIGYAQALALSGDKPGARRELLAVAGTAKDEVGVLATVGFELKNLGAFAECIEVLDRAVAKRRAGELLTYRGLCKLGAQDKPGALADLRAAVSAEPGYATAHFYLGGRLAEDGKLAEAQAAYEAYGKLAPSGELAAKARERVELLKKRRAAR